MLKYLWLLPPLAILGVMLRSMEHGRQDIVAESIGMDRSTQTLWTRVPDATQLRYQRLLQKGK